VTDDPPDVDVLLTIAALAVTLHDLANSVDRLVALLTTKETQ
jgi:metal-dependent HD superfamily phosphatase/phosphodiesterase